jgi:hypothetical protein
VFAWKDDAGQLTTGISSATAPLEYRMPELRVLRGEPATSGDLADLRNQPSTAPVSEPMHEVCGKVLLPQGTKGGDVAVLFWRPDRPGRLLQGEGADAEDDGSFCVMGLDSGSYFVLAMQVAHSGFRYLGYYPRGKDLSQARPITVETKGASPRVEFSMSRQKLYRVRGYVRALPESESSKVQVMLMPTRLEDMVNLVEPAPVGPHGLFEIAGIPRGSYSIFAVTSSDEDETVTVISTAAALQVSENLEGVTLHFVPENKPLH